MFKTLSLLIFCTTILSCSQSNANKSGELKDSLNTGKLKDSLIRVVKYGDGSAMTDLKCDGVIYQKIGNKYFKRVFKGPIQSSWYIQKNQTSLKNVSSLKKLLAVPLSSKSLNNTIYLLSGDLFSTVIDPVGNSEISGGTLKFDPSVTASNPDGANILKISTSNNKFKDVVFDGNQFAFKKEVPTRCVDVSGENNSFDHCTFKGATINGVRIYGKGHRFTNCVFTENAGTGIELIGASDIVFENCYIYKNGGGFKKIKRTITETAHEYSGFGVAVRYQSKNIHFNNSHFYLNARDGLNVNQGSHDVYINNCKVYGNDDGGITVASDVVKSGQKGDGEDCYNVFIDKSAISNNYSSGVAVYSPVRNLRITGSQSFNNNRLAGDQPFQSSYYNGIYIASGSNQIFIDNTACYDDGKNYTVIKNTEGKILVNKWAPGKLVVRNKISVYSSAGTFKGYVKINSESGNRITVSSLPFNSLPVSKIIPTDVISMKTQHNGVFIDNNCAGYCNVSSNSFKTGPSGVNFSGYLIFQGITESGNTGVSIKGTGTSKNLIKNPYFDSNLTSWAFNTPGGSVEKNGGTAKSGSSLKLLASNEAVFADCTAYNADISNNSKGKFLHFTAWVKSKGHASIQLMIAPDINIPVKYKTDRSVGNEKWEKLDCSAFVPPGVQNIICRLISEPHTTAYFDDIALYIVQP